MAVRTSQIVAFIKERLERISEGTTETDVQLPGAPYTYKNSVYMVERAYLTPDEINDFPSLLILPEPEERVYIGGGVKYGKLPYIIRGYVKETYNSDPVLDLADDLLEDLEFVINSLSYIKSSSCPVGLEESRVITCVTDEGLLQPFGVAELRCSLVYQLSETI